jgi:hypothetical protein
MSEPKLDWSTAEVSDSTLKVALNGEPPSDWRGTFERTVELLGAGDWGQIKLKKHAVHVGGVTEGSEEKLRHHLESVIQEANAAHPTEDVDDEADESGEDDKDETRTADAAMAERFRSFAQSPPPTEV